MQTHPKGKSGKGVARKYTGDVWVDIIVPGEEKSRVYVNEVRYAPGARTHWHSHPGGQTVYVTEGVGYAQSKGGPVVELHPGYILYTAPNEVHWHGAGPEQFHTNISIRESANEDAQSVKTHWFEPITDEEYNRRG